MCTGDHFLKSVSDGRKRVRRQAAPYGIDLAARVAFLHATNDLRPSPLVRLLRLKGIYRKWAASKSLIGPIAAAFQHGIDMRGLESGELERAIDKWMGGCNYVDQWLRDVARATLHAHDLGRAQPGEWWPNETLWWNELHRKVPPLAPQGGREQLFEYAAREKEHGRAVRAFLKLVPLVTGARKLNMKRDAYWTALRVDGISYKAIAKTEKGEASVGEDTIQKAVAAFAHRAGLTLPA